MFPLNVLKIGFFGKFVLSALKNPTFNTAQNIGRFRVLKNPKSVFYRPFLYIVNLALPLTFLYTVFGRREVGEFFKQARKIIAVVVSGVEGDLRNGFIALNQIVDRRQHAQFFLIFRRTAAGNPLARAQHTARRQTAHKH